MTYLPTPLELDRLREVFIHIKNEKELRSEWWKNVFVETDVYRAAQETGRCIFVGRKGAGKTALISGHKIRTPDHYFVEGPILADDFPFRILYEYFYLGSQKLVQKLAKRTSGDLPAIIDPLRISTFAWSSTLRCYAALLFISKLRALDDLTDEERAELEDYQNRAKRIADVRSPSDLPALEGPLVFFFEQVQEVIEAVLEEDFPNVAHLLATLTTRVNALLSRRRPGELDSKEILETVNKILERNDLRILITVDKFDDYYDHFVQNIEDPQELTFMSYLLEGMILAVRDIRSLPSFKHIDLLVTVPSDRFHDLQLRERAQIETEHVTYIDWRPRELWDFANTRIAWALGITGEESEEVWYKIFPKTIHNRVLADVREDSFLFLARHSHWRPRDLQRYISAIISEMKESGSPADDELFHRVISETSREIVNTGFIPEYQKSFPKLEALLNKLESIPNLPTAISYEQLKSYVREFPYANGASIEDTMVRLFDMGVVGVRKSRARKMKGVNGTIKQNKVHVAYSFSYNSRSKHPFVGEDELVFHPLFYDRLDLTHNQEFVIHQMDWSMFR